MSKKKNISPAQMIDSFLRRVGLGVAIVALAYGTSALELVLPAELADYADMARFGLSILVIIVVLPPFVKFTLARRRGECKGADTDSYMAEMFKQAAHHAFTATFVALIFIEGAITILEPQLPTVFFIDLALFISLSAFAVSFYRLTTADDTDQDDWEDAGDE